MTAVDEIKSRLDILDIVSETVKLRRSGKNYTGFCPFHDNTRTPAFAVFPESGTWRCFSCNDGGDIFKFVMKKEGWDFPQTLKYLAQRAGIELEPQTPEKQKQDEQAVRLRTLLEEAIIFYKHHLLQTPAGSVALNYLQKRGVQPATIELFGLGYAPPSWDASLTHFRSKGYTPQELLQAGLVSERAEGGGVYDRFRNRLMFPIRDFMGHMAGFGARSLDPEDTPKYLNSPQTSLFDKSRLLYGLDLARKAIRSEGQAVIVEGYLDVILPHQAGFSNTISPMGTALTEDHLRQIKRLARRIILALDPDAAGEKATLRGLEVARQTLDRSGEVGFDAHGLLRYEARLQADLRVTTLPEGMDPDEIVLRDPEEWKSLLKAARPIIIHVMEMLAARYDIEDPKAKNEIATQVLPLIADVPSPVERDSYRQRLARLLHVDESSLAVQRPAPPTPTRRRPEKFQAQPRRITANEIIQNPKKRIQSLERHSLRLLFRKPDALYPLNRVLLEAGLNRFAFQEYEDAQHQALARLVQQSLEQEERDPKQFLQANLPETLQELAEELIAPIPEGEPNEEHLIEDLSRTIIILRQARLSEGINQLRFMYEDLQAQGGEGIEAYQEMVMQYSRTKARLDQALSRL